MDFLDPRRKKAHRRRLFIGYILMGIGIIIGTITLFYLAYGYDIDRKTGTVIQNGIVFVDSKPGGAVIYLNDVRQNSRTASRMALPAGVYTVRLEAEGYRHWERTFNLEGGQIQRLVYPFLLPNVFETDDMHQYEFQPQLTSQSPDRRWVFVQQPGQTYLFDVFDLRDAQKAPVQVLVPPAILTEPAAEASLKFVEWSNDNRHVLLERTFGDRTEYIMLDRENPAQSVNINTMMGIEPRMPSLRNKRHDQLYYLDAVPGVLRVADLSSRTISAPLVSSALAYNSYGDDIVLFVTQEGMDEGRAEFRVLEGDKVYPLKSVSAADAYVLDVSRYSNKWYYVVGSAADNMAFVYENPLPALKAQTRTPLIVTAILRLENPRFVSFSANTQFIALQSGNKLLVIDLEDSRQYRTSLTHDIPLDRQLKWMDGHRLLFMVGSQSYILDFDGSNEQTLVTSLVDRPYFDRDYDNVFTLERSKQDGSRFALTRTVIED